MSARRDEKYMAEAIKLAKKATGLTSPNPIVGAVIVQSGKIIGRGYHRQAGCPHAEVEAIYDAILKGHSVRGSSMYVTLEPCSTFGKTPPCVRAILRHGLKKVFIGSLDPNPKHQGKAVGFLKSKGVSVHVGLLEEECKELIKSWSYWIQHHRPYVIAKCGMTIDGKIATSLNESKWITSPEARNAAHKIRRNVDAILVGIGTVLADDPALTVRDEGGVMNQKKKFWKIILDSKAGTPPTSRLLQTGSTWIFTTTKAPKSRIKALQNSGAIVTISPEDKAGISLDFVLDQLSKREITSLLVEGGGQVLGNFFLKKKVNHINFFVAPRIIGGATAKRSVEGPGFPNWKSSLKLENMQIRRIGEDLEVSADVLPQPS